VYKILAVDDEVSIRTMLLDFFEDRYDIEVAANGTEALRMVRKGSYDLVISDINMPGMSGPELLSQIHAMRPKTRTMLMTAYNIDDYIARRPTVPLSTFYDLEKESPIIACFVVFNLNPDFCSN